MISLFTFHVSRRWNFLPVKGLFALVFPKFGTVYFHRKNRILKHKGSRRGYFYFLANFYLNGMDINPSTDIGEGVLFQHLGAIVIGGDTKIGKDTMIFLLCDHRNK